MSRANALGIFIVEIACLGAICCAIIEVYLEIIVKEVRYECFDNREWV